MPFNNFDAFNEGVAPGGARSKNEIRTLLCYMYYSVGKPMSMETVIEALQEKSLANYFEAVTCFDDLVKFGNLIADETDNNLYRLTENGKMIAVQLKDSLPVTMKERACGCTLELLAKQRVERENPVEIKECEHGFVVNCKITDGKIDLLNFNIFAADMIQAKIIRKNFHKNPESFYKTTVALLSNNRDMARSALESIEISGHD